MNLLVGSSQQGPLELPLESLATHMVAFGATGSGKTGLLIALVEELAEAGVRVLAVDVKGDLANLAIQDPDWRRKALSEGLPERKPLDAKVYTPGMCDCNPLRLLPKGSRDPLSASWIAEAILSQTSMKGDKSAKTLLASLLLEAEATSLAELAQLTRIPPVEAGRPIGDFLPENRRRKLAGELTALSMDPVVGCLAAGEPLDLDREPPVKVVYLAHLPESIRMLAVALLLSHVYRWASSRGAGTLRLAVIFDEVYGYLPPYPRSPPAKQPLETLVRQGRGFGVSVLLATQNPRDVDYRILSNVGLWAVGLLRAKQDRQAVAEALSEVFGAPRPEVEAKIAKLRQREFLIFSTLLHEPVVVRVRHTFTPLKGPVALDALRSLCSPPASAFRVSLPQYTVEDTGAKAYKPMILARGVAVYRPPWLQRGVKREFAALVDPESLAVTKLPNLPPLRPGAPQGALTPQLPSRAQLEATLRQALAEKFYRTPSARQRAGETVEEFKERVAGELEERKHRVSERYEARLRNLLEEARRVDEGKRKLRSSFALRLARVALIGRPSSAAKALEGWLKSVEKAEQLGEEERRLAAEARKLAEEWMEELRILESRHRLVEVAVEPELKDLSIVILWVPKIRSLG